MKKNSIIKQLEKHAIAIKKDILHISYKANVGHIGSAISIADILTVLYHAILHVNPKRPLNPYRDRFILSKGHAAAALYAALYRKGFLSRKKLFSFCQDGGTLGIHPEYKPNIGIEMSTGSLGHGLSVGIGLALGLKKSKRKTLHVYVLISDAELNEGSIWEAIMFAAHHKIDNLTVIIDDNNFQAFGKAEEVIDMQPLEDKWKAFGWETKIVNGHNVEQLYTVLNNLPFVKNKPSVIIAKTKVAKGISFFEDKQEAHYMPMGKKQYAIALANISKKGK